MRKIVIPLILTLLLSTLFGSTQAFAAAAVSPYYIEVNCTTNIVAVFQKDASGNYAGPIKTFVCSSGEGTPTGTFRTTDKYTWRPLFDNVYGQYATRITGHILFHSVPYLTPKKNDLEYGEYNKLGQTASAGCIRLCVRDTKWIYDNCSRGTTVKIYRGDKTYPLAPEPVGKTDVNDTARRGWDPTDPDGNNPWLKVGNTNFTVVGTNSVMKAYNVQGHNYLKENDLFQLFALLNSGGTSAGGQTTAPSQPENGGQAQQSGQAQTPGGAAAPAQARMSGSGAATLAQVQTSGGTAAPNQAQVTGGGVTGNGSQITAEEFHKLLTQNNAATYNLRGETIYKLKDAAKLRNIAVGWSNGVITLTSLDGANIISINTK